MSTSVSEFIVEFEEWRGIPNCGGAYEVSNLGRVRSTNRTLITKRGVSKNISSKLLYVKITGDGYPSVQFAHLTTGKRQPIKIHYLVMLTFIGPRPEGAHTRHLDGNPMNNRLNNLVYGTAKENRQDSIKHGTCVMGSRHYRTTLSEQDVLEIREKNKEGMSIIELSEFYLVDKQVIYRILERLTWKHL